MALHALGSVDPRSLVDARLQWHYAAQLVAAFAQSAVEARSDDSHRSMLWDDLVKRFVSEAGAGGLQAFVNPEPLSIGLARSGADVQKLELMGTTLRTARTWMEGAVREETGNADFELGWPEYDLPAHFVEGDRPFQAKAVSLAELTRWFSAASARLARLVESESDASPVRTWPHHFDIATLIVVERDTEGAPSQTVGVGLSPGDGSFAEPYWYVNAWGYAEDTAFPELQTPGHTHREGWSGFVLTATELIQAGKAGRADPGGEGDRQALALDSFLDRAVSAAKALFQI